MTRKPLLPLRRATGATLASVASLLLVVGCDDGVGTTSSGGSGGGATVSSSASVNMTSSSTGVVAVEASDTCPGNVVNLGLNQTVELKGTTVGAKDDYHEFCADSDPMTTSAPDVVFQLELPEYCSFFADLVEADTAFDGAFQLRAASCSDRTGGDDCQNLNKHGEHLGREVPPGTYFLIVDGANKTSGEFTLTVSCKAPACGDGIINSAEEQCDPGAPTPGDGCGDPATPSACKFQASTAPDTCGDITDMSGTIGIAKGQNLFVPAELPLFNAAAANDDYAGTCSYTDFSGPDQVFAVKPTGSGVLTVILGRDYNGIDYCQPPNYDQAECWNSVAWMHEADCSNDKMKELPKAGNSTGCIYSIPDVATNNVLTFKQDVEAGKTYYLFIEGDTPEVGHSGPYLLNVKLD